MADTIEMFMQATFAFAVFSAFHFMPIIDSENPGYF